jgi:hypothetical protein
MEDHPSTMGTVVYVDFHCTFGVAWRMDGVHVRIWLNTKNIEYCREGFSLLLFRCTSYFVVQVKP